VTGPPEEIRYTRARFRTRLPRDRRYTAAHFWLLEESPGVWRVGFTRFATRMLGDIVECDFAIQPGEAVAVGQEIGSLEGFKAVTALFSVAEGEFLGPGDALTGNITAVESDPHGRGWLYRVRGRPDPESLDVQEYIAVLDATIDRLLETRYAAGEGGDDAEG
jgi:glycine cleavage system H protein